jgi:hypothetical protein
MGVMMTTAVIGNIHCASTGAPLGVRTGTQSYPDWIKVGSCATQAPATPGWVGLGEVRGIRNVALARSTANNRARAELVRLFEAYETQLLRGYAPLKGEDLTPTLKLLTASTLLGIQIVEHWFHPDDGSVYALARLDLAHFTQHAAQLRELDAPLRAYLAQQSEPIFNAFTQDQDRRERVRMGGLSCLF